MPLPANLPAALVETALARVALHFIAGAHGDQTAARKAATQLLADYRPETAEELCLAGDIITFGFQALAALGESMDADLPTTRVLRLRSSAVSLSRERFKAQRQLKVLRKARRQAAQPQPEEVTKMPEPVTIQPAPTQNRTLTPAQIEEQRQTDQRILNSIKRAEAKFGITATPTPAQPQPVIAISLSAPPPNR